MTTDQFVAKAGDVHGNRYSYELVQYKAHNAKVVLICPEHGEFSITPNKHLSGRGCRACRDQRFQRDRQLSFWVVAARCLWAHEIGRYDRYDLRGYVNQQSSIGIHCPAHGWFQQSAVVHWKGHGCFRCSDSKGERRIRRYLKLYEIKFIEQMRFEECRDKRPLPFDFYLPKHRVLIEYDGTQHFERSGLWGGQQGLEQTQRHDAIRDCFAAEQGFRLIRIPYWDFDRIEAILTEEIASMSLFQQKRTLSLCLS